jgi:hypothetical protein
MTIWATNKKQKVSKREKRNEGVVLCANLLTFTTTTNDIFRERERERERKKAKERERERERTTS